MRYAAFLRGVNVGGKRPLKMEALRYALAQEGLTNIATHGLSGNAVFDYSTEDEEVVRQKVEAVVYPLCGPTDVILRSRDELAEILAADPFAKMDVPPSHCYVTLLAAPAVLTNFPANQGWLALVRPREIYSVPIRTGEKYTYPSAAVERLAKAPATTRNWAVLKTVARLLGDI